MNDQPMTDKEIDAVLRTWTPDAPAGHPDRSRVVGNVVRQLHSTRRRRRHWWRTSVFRRTAAATIDAERHIDQASPIPATNGHPATITGRTQFMFSPVKAITAGALVFAIGGVLLIAQPFDQQAGSVPGAATDVVEGPEPAVLVTGQFLMADRGEQPFEEERGVDGLTVQRGRDSGGQAEMSDARLSGDVVLRDNADRWCPEACSPELMSDLLWGTIEVTNDDGSWVGTSVGTTDASAGGAGVTYYELVGAGAYDGLSAILFESETDEGFLWNGVIFPGDLPPDR